MKQRPAQAGQVLDGVDWTRWSVVLLKPDCVRRNLTGTVLQRIARSAEVIHTSDDSAATCRDFGTWFGADQFERLFPRDDGRALVARSSPPT